MNSCPQPDELRQALANQLPEARQHEVWVHVEACSNCLRALDELTACPCPELQLASPTRTIPLEQNGASSNRLPSVPGYELLGEVGRGGRGVVYKARHLALKRIVAVKIILSGVHASAEQRARFLAEAEAVARLRHPHIVPIYDINAEADPPHFTLEYLEGGSLKDYCAGQPLPARDAAALTEMLARALAHAHRHGIVHRDLKPENILLQKVECPGPTEADAARHPGVLRAARFVLPKVADFGVAKFLDGAGPRTRTGEVLGTPPYMAPEQAVGRSSAIGPATDLYGLGALLYELLTGRPPFLAETAFDTLERVVHDEPVPPRQLQPKVPRGLETICLKCLEKQPAQRYGSADELADDLRRFLDGQPVHAQPLGLAARGWRWCRRNPRVAALLAVLLTVVAGSFASVTHLLRQTAAALDSERQAHHDAERNLDAARQILAKFFVIGQAPHLQTPALLRSRHELLREVEGMYGLLLQSQGETSRLRVEQAEWLTVLALLNLSLGQCAEAERQAREAVAHWRALELPGSADGRVRVGLAKALQLAAEAVHEQPHRTAEALAFIRQAHALWETMPASEDAEHAWWHRARVRYLRGHLLRFVGDHQGGLAALREGRAYLEGLFQDHPFRLELQALLALTCHDLGNALNEVERPNEGVPCWQRACDLRRRLMEVLPGNPDVKVDHAESCRELAVCHLKQGQPSLAYHREALHSYQRAVDDFAGLLKDDPANAQFAGKLVKTLQGLLACALEAGLPAEALAAFGSSLRTLEELVAAHVPEVPLGPQVLDDWYRLLESPPRAGQSAAGKEAVRQTFARLLPRAVGSPRDTEYRRELAVLATELGTRLAKGKTPADALPPLREAVRILSELTRNSPSDLSVWTELARSHRFLGSACLKANQTEEMLNAWRKGLAAQRRLFDHAPSVTNHRELSRCYDRLTWQLYTCGHLLEAAVYLREQVQLWPGDPWKLFDIAGDLDRLALACADPERQRYLGDRNRLIPLVEAALKRRAANP